jgi:nicotinamidase/pyrazinamidase
MFPFSGPAGIHIYLEITDAYSYDEQKSAIGEGIMEKPFALQDGDALLVVDMQNCFLPGGNLAIPGSDRVIKPVNRMIRFFEHRGLPLAFSRDWHPADHVSFKEQGGPWPTHGVAGTDDAAFSPALDLPVTAAVFSKATTKNSEEYSAFLAKNETGMTFQSWLEKHAIKRVWIGGLATDYCVLNTVADLRQAGYAVIVLTDTVHAVNVTAGDGERALAEMAAQGAEMVETDQVKA